MLTIGFRLCSDDHMMTKLKWRKNHNFIPQALIRPRPNHPLAEVCTLRKQIQQELWEVVLLSKVTGLNRTIEHLVPDFFASHKEVVFWYQRALPKNSQEDLLINTKGSLPKGGTQTRELILVRGHLNCFELDHWRPRGK